MATLELHLQASRDPLIREAAFRSMAAYDRLAAAVLEALGLLLYGVGPAPEG